MNKLKELQADYYKTISDYLGQSPPPEQYIGTQYYDSIQPPNIIWEDVPKLSEPRWPRLSFLRAESDQSFRYMYQRRKWEHLRVCYVMIENTNMGKVQAKPHVEFDLTPPKDLSGKLLLAYNTFINVLKDNFSGIKIHEKFIEPPKVEEKPTLTLSNFLF